MIPLYYNLVVILLYSPPQYNKNYYTPYTIVELNNLIPENIYIFYFIQHETCTSNFQTQMQL